MPLGGFTESTFEHDGVPRVLFRRGKGPGVVVMHEIPGITPQVASFATRVADAGFSVVMPSLFGTPGKAISRGYVASEVAGVCIRHEFQVLASRRASPITEWLRALCRSVHAELGGPGVGCIGMCVTGNFALALMVDEAVMAPVLCQPSLPAPFGRARRAALHISDEALVTVKARAASGVKVLGLRFTNDRSCPKERFDSLRRELGTAFEAIEIDSSKGNAAGIPTNAHSVVTTHLIDDEGHPTRAALDRVISFFREQLVR